MSTVIGKFSSEYQTIVNGAVANTTSVFNLQTDDGLDHAVDKKTFNSTNLGDVINVVVTVTVTQAAPVTAQIAKTGGISIG